MAAAQALSAAIEALVLDRRAALVEQPSLHRDVYRVENLRGKALAAAAEILATLGQEKLSLKNIADSAGIGITSIYHYFACKDDLLTSLAIQGFEDSRCDMVRYQKLPEYPEPMAAATQAFLHFAEARPAHLSLMFSERLLARSEILRRAEEAALLTYCAAVEADDRIPRDHRTNVGYALWTVGRGIAGRAASSPDGRVPLEDMTKLLAGASYLINR